MKRRSLKYMQRNWQDYIKSFEPTAATSTRIISGLPQHDQAAKRKIPRELFREDMDAYEIED